MNGSVLFEGNPILSGSLNVNTGGNIEPLEIEINENGRRTITPPEGVDGYAPITIDTNVPIPEPVLDTLNVTSNGTYTPPSGVDGYDEITVNVSQDVDIQPLTRTITTNGTTIINASDLNVDGFNPVTITTAVDGYTIKTLANTPLPIASFNDGTSNPLKSLTASIVPVQAGSGDPSPSNVRPISGWTEEVITVTDDLQNPTVTHTTTIPFTDSQGNPVEVYGGSVDVTGGESTIVGKKFLLAPTDSQIFNVTNRSCVLSAPETANGFTLAVTNLLCNKLKPSNYSTAEDNHIHFANATLLTIYTSEDVGTTKEDWIQWFDDMQVEIYYKLATPTTFYTQPTSIKSLDGENNVSASTGDVEELKYFTRATS